MSKPLRSHFPIFAHYQGHYLDSAATCHKPNVVLQRMQRFFEQQNANVHRSSYPLAHRATLDFEQARKSVQRFINAERPEEIVWTKGVTEGLNLLAYTLAECHLKSGDEIAISCLEHHANIVPWQQVAARVGAKLVVLPVDDNGCLQLQESLALIGKNTAVLAITHVSNALGNINPVEALIDKARQHRAVVIVDGAQAISHVAVDVQALDCDFYLFSGHKIYAPTGIGVLYGRYAWLEKLPPYQTGGEMVQRVSFQQTDFMLPPLKFEAGTPNVAGVLGLASAIDFVQQHREAITCCEQQLYQHLIEGLQQIRGLQLWGEIKNSVAIQSFTLRQVNVQDMALLLAEQGIALRAGHHCAMPLMQRLDLPGTLRVSLACYNQLDDVHALLRAIERALAHLKNPPSTPTNTHPSGQIAQEIKQAKGWDQKYRRLMLAGKQLVTLTPEERGVENELFGCESQVWLKCTWNCGGLQVRGYSPSKIVRGLLVVIFEAVQGLSVQQIQAFDLEAYLRDLGLDRHLSESRGNGLRAVITAIKQQAQQQDVH